MANTTLQQLDPVQGLIDYVLDVKPYHTKIVEVLVEYVFNEPVDVTIEDEHHLQVDLFRPETTDLSSECRDGYSERGFGDPGLTPILSPDQNLTFENYPAIDAVNNTFVVPNDRTFDFLPGTRVVLTSFIEDYGSPFMSNVHSIIEVIRTDAGTTFPAPAGTGAFVIEGDHVAQFIIGDPFDVFSSGVNDKTYIVRAPGASFDGTNTTIPVAQAVLSGTAAGRLGLVTTVAANTGIFTVVSSEFDGGSIGSWPDRTDPGTFRVGIDPHTIVTVQEPLTDPSLEILAPQVYVAFVMLENVAYEMVLSYSNPLFNYDGGVPISSQTPDEGYFRAPLVDYQKSTLDGFMVPIPGTGEFTFEGDLTRSNVFIGGTFRILEATDLQGLYTISAISYDLGLNRTTFNVVEGVIGDTLDGIIQLDIPSNMFFVDGDLTARFIQGTVFDIVGGNLQGTYTTLYSDYVDGKTRIRTFEEIHDVGHGFNVVAVSVNQFQLVGNVASKFPIGLQFNVVESNENDGSYTVDAVTFNAGTNRTEIDVTNTLDTDAPFGQLFPVALGFVHEHVFGFGESSDICSNVPETIVAVNFDEQIRFSGFTLDLHDDVIAHNMENTDQWGYEIPFRTINAPTAPPVPESASPPVGLDGDADPTELNSLWFDTTTQLFKQWNNVLPSASALNWKPIVTAFWREDGTNLFYYRTKNNVVDTGWIIFLSEAPGFNSVFSSVGRTEFICRELFRVEDAGGSIPEDTYELQTCVVPHWDITAVDTTPGASSFEVAGNVLGIDTAPFTKLLVTDTPGNLNDGTYTLVNAVFGAGVTTIFTKEDIPDSGVGGDIIHQTNLLMVKVNGVPAGFTFNSSTSFTVTSPEFFIGDEIQADVFDQTATQTNAIVLKFGDEPHQVFHDNVVSDDINNAFTLGGGNYARRFTGNFSFTSMDDLSIKGTHHARMYPILDVEPVLNDVLIQGDATWLFSAGRVAVLFTSQNNSGEYVIQSSSYNGIDDVTTITFTSPTLFESLPKFNPPYTPRDIDGATDTIEIYGDQTFNFQAGTQFVIDTQMVIEQASTDRFFITGNHTAELPAGVVLRTVGSSPQNDETEFTVISASFAAGRTQIVVVEPVPTQTGAVGDMFTVWTTSTSTFVPYVGPPLPIADPEQYGYTSIVTIENLPVFTQLPAHTVHQYIEQNIVDDLGVLLGAVYDPSVSGVGDQPKTIVATTNSVDPTANAVIYTWVGPLRMTIDRTSYDNAAGSFMDGLGMSNELLGVPDRFVILDTDETLNTFVVHYDDPLTGFAVNLIDRFSPGTVFTVAGSYGDNNPSSIESNDARYVVESATWDEFGTGDTTITVETDLTNLPPYNTFTVVSMSNQDPLSESLTIDFDDDVTAVDGTTLTSGGVGDYFDIDSTTSAYRVWFDDTTNVAPAAGGRTLVVVPFTLADSSITIASSVVSVLQLADADFVNASNAGGTSPVVYLPLVTPGPVADAVIGVFPTPPIITIITQGINGTGQPSTIELAGDQRSRFDKLPITEAFRLDVPLVSTSSLENVIHVTDTELSSGNTILTVSETFLTTSYTGDLEVADASYRANIYWDEVNATPTWVHGYIIRVPMVIDTLPENTANTTINEDFMFGWGTTYEWAIVDTDAGADTVLITGDITTFLDVGDDGTIRGSEANDGEYEIVSFSFNGTETEIILLNPPQLTDPTETAGQQIVDVSVVNGDTVTGLANDATVYTATVAVDGGGAQPIAITGSAAQTYTDLLAELNTDTAGATWDLEGGNVRVQSGTTGSTSTVSIVDTDLFSSLTTFIAVRAPVDGTDGFHGYFRLDNLDITAWFQYLIHEINANTNELIVFGDATSDIQLGQQIRVLGTPSNDDLYTVSLAPTYDGIADETTIEVAEPLNFGENEINQIIDSDTIKVTGKAANFLQGGDVFSITGSTGNDGAYVVEGAEYDGMFSEITITGTFPDSTGDGTLQFYERGGWVESYKDYGIRLYWSDVLGVQMAESADVAVETEGGQMLGAWEYPYWDIGAYDESLDSVIHLYSSTFEP